MLYVPYPIILYPMMYELPWHPSQLNQKSYIISAVQSAFTISFPQQYNWHEMAKSKRCDEQLWTVCSTQASLTIIS